MNRPRQADIDAFLAIAAEIRNANVQDAKTLATFKRLGWVTTVPGLGNTERWVLTAAGVYLHAHGYVRPEGEEP